jgi:5-methylcytosine-specific restriction endonuclease McrA
MQLTTRFEARAEGVKWYFTGKPCKNGHISRRLVSNGSCDTCCRIRAKKYYHSDLDKAREYGRCKQRQRRIEKPEAVREYDRQHYWKNPEAEREYNRMRRAERAERYNANRRAAYKQNREYKIAIHKKYRKANPDIYRAAIRNRKARAKNADGKHSHKDIAAIRKMQSDKCALCKVKLRGGGHVDHIHPISKGGSNWPRNLQILCAPCNLDKRAKDPIEYAQQLGMLL